LIFWVEITKLLLAGQETQLSLTNRATLLCKQLVPTWPWSLLNSTSGRTQ